MKTADRLRQDAGVTTSVFWSTVKPCRHYRRLRDGCCADCDLSSVPISGSQHLRIYEDFAL